MLKLMYLEKRNPALTRDQFTRRWRMHGARSMTTKFTEYSLCYSQAEPIIPSPVPGGCEDYDAIAYNMISDNAFTDPRTPETAAEGKMMTADELETFSQNISPNSILWVREEQVKPGEPGGVTAFLFFKDADLARQAAKSCQTVSDLNRVTLNLRQTDADKYGVKSTLPFEAIVELAAKDRATLVKVATGPAASAIASADLTVYTRECMMWDRLSDK